MKLLRISLRDFRGIVESEVRLDTTGVTVVEGPNEVGKSSLAAAVDLLFDELDSSRKRHVLQTQPVTRDVAPWIEVEFTTGDYHVVFGKQYVKKPQTWLRVLAPRQEQASGRQAHQRVQQILADTMDFTLWRALRVEQGQSLQQAVVSGAASLGAALETAAGTTPGIAVTSSSAEQEEIAATLMDRVTTEYARYFTKTGKPTGEYAQAATELEERTQHEAEVAKRLDGVEGDVTRIEQIATELQRIEAEQQERGTELAELEERAHELDQAREAVRAAEQQLSVARRAGEQAERDLRERHDASNDLHRRVGEREQLQHQLEAAGSELAAAQSRADDAQAAVDSAQQQLARSDELARSAADALALLRDRDDLAGLRERQERAQTAQAALTAARTGIDATDIDEAVLASIEAAHETLRLAEAARDAGATSLEVQQLGDHEVCVDGAGLGAGGQQQQPVVSTTTVTIEGIARVVVRPGRDGRELSADVETAQTICTELLREHGATDLEDARRQAAQRRDHTVERDRQEHALEVALDGQELADLEVRIATIQARVAGLNEPADPDRPEASVPATIDEAAEAERHARHARHEAAEAVEAATQRATEATGAVDSLRQDAVRKEQQLASAAAEIQAASEKLDAARAEADDSVLANTVEEAHAHIQRWENELVSAEHVLRSHNPDELEIRLTNARSVRERLETQQRALQDEHQRVRGRLSAVESEGLHDQIADAQAALDSARTRWESTHRRAEAARLLRDTLIRHRDEARRRYVQPYQEAVGKLGRVVFGSDFDVEVGSDLQVLNRTLHGATVDFDALSSGAQEQLALICRLAVAQLVSDSGGAPVIIDDALGYADPVRLERLCAVLNHAGAHSQIVVLTCQPERFAAIGSAQVVQLRS